MDEFPVVCLPDRDFHIISRTMGIDPCRDKVEVCIPPPDFLPLISQASFLPGMRETVNPRNAAPCFALALCLSSR